VAKRFRFQLETLLRVRQLREREAQRKVAAKRAEIAQLDRFNEQTAREISEQQNALLRDQQPGQVNPTRLVRGRAWIMHLRGVIAQREAQRAVLARALEQLLTELRQARTQTRIIEKLRQRRWDAYRRQRDRREQAEADELAQQLQTLPEVRTAREGLAVDAAQPRTARVASCAAGGGEGAC
jgi:flagellar FliJ protein